MPDGERSLDRMMERRPIAYWTSPQECCNPAWEAAYARFETPAEETAKFLSRLRGLGVERWPRNLRVVELFCGRGGGLDAWSQLGFSRLEGVDISEGLLRRYAGPAQLYVGDARRLELPDRSRDVVCVQGGLHHLSRLPEDLRATLAEVRRVLQPGGRMVVIEPWSTPFLRAVHVLCDRRWLRALSPRIYALGCMIDQERETYLAWLARPGEIMAELTRGFTTESKRVAWGKLSWVGRPVA